MAETSNSISLDLYRCPLCWNLLKDPVTIPCGRSFCEVCINNCWDQEHVKGVYSCPQCRETFNQRTVQCRNNMLSRKVEELKKTEPQAASPAHSYAGPGDVECDSYTARKCKAISSCLVCLASYCEDHLKPHYQSQAFKKRKSVEACAELQEKICSQHYYLCTKYEHKGHDKVSANAERTKQQNELKEEWMKSQEKQKEVQELKEIVDTIKSFPSLCVSPGCEDSPSFTVHQHLSSGGVSDLKNRVEEICQEEFNQIRPQAAAISMVSPSDPRSREDFEPYFCYLTLDPNTAHHRLILSEKNRAVTRSKTEQRYSHHPERFHSYNQVLCKESVCGRCYWEVEWTGSVTISVAYKQISRKGQAYECVFGYNPQSWSLQCSSSSVSFWHNNIKTELRGPASSRIGVYVDHSAGTLSFYSVSDTMRLLHNINTTFTQPLYPGFRVWNKNSTVRLCDPE